MKALNDIRNQEAEKFTNEVLPLIYKFLDKADINYSEDQLELLAEDAFKHGFDCCAKSTIEKSCYDDLMKEAISLRDSLDSCATLSNEEIVDKINHFDQLLRVKNEK